MGAGALMFDGSNDYVQLGNEVSLKPTVFTVEAWFNYASTTSYENIISMHYNDVTLNINPSRKLCGSMYTSGATCTNSTVSSGSWHYGVFTFDGSTTRIFLDGKEENSTSGSLTWEVGSSYPLRIGTNANGIEQAFSGALDSARIYSRVLSAAEILSNYNAGNVEIQTRTGATSDPNDGTWERLEADHRRNPALINGQRRC